MKASVVIVSYKVPYHLMLCLESLHQATKDLDAEIIVIDNASEDQTQSLVSKYFPQVRYIQNHTNDGFSKANNIAIKKANGEYICLVNPDTIIAETSIKSSIDKHQNLKRCGILGIKLIDGTGNFLPESKINKLTLKVAALKMLGFSKQYYNRNLPENGEGQTVTLVGAFMCFRKKDYEQLDGLDERYFMYGEDIDLSYQFSKAGFQNYYLGKENILHFKGESTLKNEVYFERFFQSVKLFFTKHYTNSKLMIGILSIFFILAKRFKKSDIQKGSSIRPNFQDIYIIGERPNFYKKIEKYYNQSIRTLNFNKAKTKALKNSLIIFNTRELSYQQTFDLMHTHRESQNLFRFVPQRLDVLIGSDSSTSQGEVIRFD